MISKTNPLRESMVRASPIRTGASSTWPANRTTRSSSPRPTTSARPWPSISLTVTISPTISYPPASTTVSASLSMTSWPGRRRCTSIAGLAPTCILRPEDTTSTLPSVRAPRNVA
jgi:hypothetical protein